MGAPAIEALLRRDRYVLLAAVILIAALAWLYLVEFTSHMMPAPGPGAAGPASMAGMDMSGMTMPAPGPGPAFLPRWSWSHGAILLGMWTVMMVGMMLPSVTPMLLIYLRVAQQAAARGYRFVTVGWFTAGYLAAWVLFSLTATAAQGVLEVRGLMSSMMVTESSRLAGALLVVVGIFQWTPLKNACLAQCRAPLAFIQRHGGFQSTAAGSLRLGFIHGLYCIGCCWALMAVLFVAGVMNLLWIAALMVLVLLEKLVPRGALVARGAGLAAVACGLWLIATAV